MKLEWEKDERKSGDWADVDPDYCRQMCINGLEMHLSELESCMELNGGPNLQKWRQGERNYWPSPDGFGFEIIGKHPLSSDGDLSLIEAWEITRPWFVEPDAEKFSLKMLAGSPSNRTILANPGTPKQRSPGRCTQDSSQYLQSLPHCRRHSWLTSSAHVCLHNRLRFSSLLQCLFQSS